MKSPLLELSWKARRVMALGAILLIVGGCSNSKTGPDQAGKKEAAAKTNAIQVVVVKESMVETNSIFDDKLNVGSDPFFPNSGRRATPKASAVSEAVYVKPVLTLNSIVGHSKRRVALINNRTFAEGETAVVQVPSGQVRVRWLNIRERTVLVSIEGEAEQKLLKLTQ